MINLKSKKPDNIIDKLFEKLKNYKSKEINLEKMNIKVLLTF